LSAPRLERDTQRPLALLQMVDAVSRSHDPAEALLQLEQLLAAFFSASKVGFCILDCEFRYLAINPTLVEIDGFPAEDHLGKSVRELGEILPNWSRSRSGACWKPSSPS
jgi:PAS domain-containing protein